MSTLAALSLMMIPWLLLSVLCAFFLLRRFSLLQTVQSLCSQDSVGMLKSLSDDLGCLCSVSFGHLDALSCLMFSIENFLWQSLIRHSCNIVYTDALTTCRFIKLFLRSIQMQYSFKSSFRNVMKYSTCSIVM